MTLRCHEAGGGGDGKRDRSSLRGGQRHGLSGVEGPAVTSHEQPVTRREVIHIGFGHREGLDDVHLHPVDDDATRRGLTD